MQSKSSKFIRFESVKTQSSFSAERLTQYGGLSVLFKFIEKCDIPSLFDDLFPTFKHNATKYSTTQVLLSFLCSALCGVKRISNIETFTKDVLIKTILGLKKHIDEDTLSKRISSLGQKGAILLHERLLTFNKSYLDSLSLQRITLDLDSTEQTVYGHQDGAAKGYNPHKKGANSYHPILCYVSEVKYLVNSWFRTGSAYTANGVVDFVRQTLETLPDKVTSVFLRADSGFFNGALFDLLEQKGHTYLVKVKLKNLKDLLKQQSWSTLPCNANMSVSKFEYKAKSWTTTRTLHAVRVIVGYVEVDNFGKIERVAQYKYFCYCSNLPFASGEILHEIYGQRAESENWIEQTKNHLLAGQTRMQNFNGNDILWQLSVLAYNISIMMRYATCKKSWREEYKTFRDWFVKIPAKVVSSARNIYVKMAKYYHAAQRWSKLEQLILRI
ncbi:MAG TPA: IS1380 family transposase [Defluviitaleaceae bacterium]|nr:IS1380 family transposase [Defluviitaleaceae bacterium]